MRVYVIRASSRQLPFSKNEPNFHKLSQNLRCAVISVPATFPKIELVGHPCARSSKAVLMEDSDVVGMACIDV